ncbi:MAG: hydantoinase/oxoprolinase family protein [Betaproteobacteria bacterium]|nr:hydantoinase/oxoprolinase family protein [Betaproteobacteria bacterium]
MAVMDEDTSEVAVYKVPSTPDEPSNAFLSALREVCATRDPKLIRFTLYGTTVMINAVIMRKGAKTALVITRGFGDLLEMGKKDRSPDIYDLFYVRPPTLVPRSLIFEVGERLDRRGEIVNPLDLDDLAKVVNGLRENGVEAVAVSLLHSYVNPSHERRVKEMLEQALPGIPVCISSEVDPQIREYQRTSTTVMNAYVMPLANADFCRLQQKVKEEGVNGPVNIMQANGGIMTIPAAVQRPINTLLSTHSGALTLASTIGAEIGERNLVVIDLGGTSLDIGFIHDGAADRHSETQVAGQPVRLAMLESFSIGAGGGSIAWIDDGGALRVGPHSAGAVPGPICYGRGGERPTVTDANLVLGRLSPAALLAGRFEIAGGATREILLSEIGKPLGLTIEQAATAILRVVNACIVEEMRLRFTQKGYDPRNFSLFVVGGAGPLQAGVIAQELGIGKVIVPRYPGIASAMGFLFADFKYDFAMTLIREMRSITEDELRNAFVKLEAQAVRQLENDGFTRDRIHMHRYLDMRYTGQGYNISVTLDEKSPFDVSAIEARFHAEHHKLYGHSDPDSPVQIVNFAVTGEGLVPKPRLTRGDSAGSSEGDPRTRDVFFEECGGWIKCEIIDRESLRPGSELGGPCIIEQMDCTTLVHPGQRIQVDQLRNLIIINSAGR